MSLPQVIQAGMGANISCPGLVMAAARRGCLGVLSGTALDAVLVGELGLGDPGGHNLRSVAKFQDLYGFGMDLVEPYYRCGGKAIDEKFLRPFLINRMPPPIERIKLMILANYVFVDRAKQGHSGRVGINYMEEIGRYHLYSMLGAMLAGIDSIVVGAGIPLQVPDILNKFSRAQKAVYRLPVSGSAEPFPLELDPKEIFPGLTELKRPDFMPIVSSNALANILNKKLRGEMAALILEGPSAGGHNASPREKGRFNELGEPLYDGPKDYVDEDALLSLGLPVFRAGGQGTRAGLLANLARGYAGNQIGTRFALCEESGLEPSIKRTLLDAIYDGTLIVRADPKASPTGFPFQVPVIAQSAVNPVVEALRKRICDLAYLGEYYRKEDGTLGHRCPSEPVNAYVRKGGKIEDTVGRLCLCNGLMANIGLAQIRAGGAVEPVLPTLGKNVEEDVRPLLRFHGDSFTADDVIDDLEGKPPRRRQNSP